MIKLYQALGLLKFLYNLPYAIGYRFVRWNRGWGK